MEHDWDLPDDYDMDFVILRLLFSAPWISSVMQEEYWFQLGEPAQAQLDATADWMRPELLQHYGDLTYRWGVSVRWLSLLATLAMRTWQQHRLDVTLLWYRHRV